METIFLTDSQIIELKKQLNYNKKLIYNLKKFIKMNDKNKKEFFNNLSFLKKNIHMTSLQIDDLINKKILSYISEQESRLTFTFKGLIIVEYDIKKPGIKINNLLDDLNKLFFEDVMKLSQEPIISREKAIILGLLGLMALSDDYSLKPKKENINYIKNSVDLAANFIKSLGSEYDDGSLQRLWCLQVEGEGPILGEFRRTNKIPIHTEGLYKKGKGHYLNILYKNNIDKEKLFYLLKRIFNKRPLSYPEKKNLIKTLDEIRQYEFKIFKDNPQFNSLDMRKQIKKLIESDI